MFTFPHLFTLRLFILLVTFVPPLLLHCQFPVPFATPLPFTFLLPTVAFPGSFCPFSFCTFYVCLLRSVPRSGRSTPTVPGCWLLVTFGYVLLFAVGLRYFILHHHYPALVAFTVPFPGYTHTVRLLVPFTFRLVWVTFALRVRLVHYVPSRTFLLPLCWFVHVRYVTFSSHFAFSPFAGSFCCWFIRFGSLYILVAFLHVYTSYLCLAFSFTFTFTFIFHGSPPRPHLHLCTRVPRTPHLHIFTFTFHGCSGSPFTHVWLLHTHTTPLHARFALPVAIYPTGSFSPLPLPAFCLCPLPLCPAHHARFAGCWFYVPVPFISRSHFPAHCTQFVRALHAPFATPDGCWFVCTARTHTTFFPIWLISRVPSLRSVATFTFISHAHICPLVYVCVARSVRSGLHAPRFPVPPVTPFSSGCVAPLPLLPTFRIYICLLPSWFVAHVQFGYFPRICVPCLFPPLHTVVPFVVARSLCPFTPFPCVPIHIYLRFPVPLCPFWLVPFAFTPLCVPRLVYLRFPRVPFGSHLRSRSRYARFHTRTVTFPFTLRFAFYVYHTLGYTFPFPVPTASHTLLPFPSYTRTTRTHSSTTHSSLLPGSHGSSFTFAGCCPFALRLRSRLPLYTFLFVPFPHAFPAPHHVLRFTFTLFHFACVSSHWLRSRFWFVRSTFFT